MGRRKIRGGDTFIPPYVIPVAAEDLHKAQWMMQAGFDWNDSLPDDAETDMDDGPLPRYLQAGFSLIEEFCAGDSAKFMSLTTRVMALAMAMRSEKLSPWVIAPSDDASPECHPAILDVAATLPIRASGKFDTTLFRNEVRRVAREKYPDIGTVPRQDGQ